MANQFVELPSPTCTDMWVAFSMQQKVRLAKVK